MLVIEIIGFVILIFILGNVIAGVICYYKLAIPNMKPLLKEELNVCKKIIKQKQGYPFVCKNALKTGKCPCLPCKKLNKYKEKFYD